MIMLALILIVAAGIGITGCARQKPQSPEELARASAVDLRKALQDTIKDAGRLQQILAIADRTSADVETGASDLAKLLQEQDRLNGDYNASREEFRQLGDRIQVLRKEHRSRFISDRNALAQLATDEEWKKIASRELTVF
jgi:hypothetical protein